MVLRDLDDGETLEFDDGVGDACCATPGTSPPVAEGEAWVSAWLGEDLGKTTLKKEEGVSAAPSMSEGTREFTHG